MEAPEWPGAGGRLEAGPQASPSNCVLPRPGPCCSEEAGAWGTGPSHRVLLSLPQQGLAEGRDALCQFWKPLAP